MQVIRKQFPLRPAAAKAIHRSQGDTETKIVVNLETRRTIPHIHYVGLSRVTTPRIPAALICSTLRDIMITLPTVHNIFIGDFNHNWLNKHERTPLYNLFVHELHYKQMLKHMC